MKRIILVIAVLLLAATVLFGCAKAAAPAGDKQPPVEGGASFKGITPANLESMLENKDFLLVNVHVPYIGEIPGTDDLVPYDQIAANISRFPADKGAKIVVYCQSGSMGAIAAKSLAELGYTDVSNLDGGMIGWERRGFELVRIAR